MFIRIFVIILVIVNKLFCSVNFANPESTQSDQLTPNLSNSGSNSSGSNMAASNDGAKVYVIFLNESAGVYKLQFVSSNDFGQNWGDIIDLPFSSNVSLAKIATDFTGTNIYIICVKYDVANNKNRVNIVYSNNGGSTWNNSNYLSDVSLTAQSVSIVTDDVGQNVIASWSCYSGGINYRIQSKYSNDFGSSWQNPNTTNIVTISPNISLTGQIASSPSLKIAKNYVFAIWSRQNDSVNSTIQMIYSDDFGKTWYLPNTANLGTVSPNISLAGFDAVGPKISSDNSGRYVYSTWLEQTGAGYQPKVAISYDYGKTWLKSFFVASEITPTYDSDITTDSSGKFVYVIFLKVIAEDSVNRTRVRTLYSNDYGNTWNNPDTSNLGTISPSLSVNFFSADNIRISTNSSGQLVNAIWTLTKSGKNYVQEAYSVDYGRSWNNPSSTPSDLGSPNLSTSLYSASNLSILTTDSGKYIYTIWKINNGINTLIQAAIGYPTFISFPIPKTFILRN